MINKEKIKNIVKNLVTNKNKKLNFCFYSSIKKLNKIKKNGGVLIFYKEQILISFIKVLFYFLYTKITFEKNCFLLFKIKNNFFIGHNFLPDWPGAYLKNNFLKNTLIWLQKFIYLFIFKKRLTLIFIEIT